MQRPCGLRYVQNVEVNSLNVRVRSQLSFWLAVGGDGLPNKGGNIVQGKQMPEFYLFLPEPTLASLTLCNQPHNRGS
jgi:hypothetical protein